MHNVFLTSKLCQYIPDHDQAIVSEPIKVTGDLVYEE